MKTAVIPGSFDPMTLGHRDLVERALGLFDSVVVAIMKINYKQSRFTLSERKKIAELTLRDLDRVKVITADGYLADLAASLGACAIVKGVRNAQDFEYEYVQAEYNAGRNPDAQTLLLPAYKDMKDVSSTRARELLDRCESTSGILDPAAAEFISRCRGRKKNAEA